MKKLLLLWAAIAAPVFAQQSQGGGITQPGGAATVTTSPNGNACTNSPTQAQAFIFNGTVYTCQSGTYQAVTGTAGGTLTGITANTGLTGGGTSGNVPLAIDSTVTTLTGSQTLTNKSLTSPALTGTPTVGGTAIGPYVVTPTVTGDGTLNATSGALAVSKIAGVAPGTLFPLNIPAAGPTVSTGSGLANGARAVQNNASNLTVLADLPSLLDYAVNSGHSRFGGITTTASSVNVSAATALFNSSEVGQAIVVAVPGTTNEFQSTIATFVDSTHITLAAAPSFSTTTGDARFGPDQTTQIDAFFAALTASNLCGHLPSGFYFYAGSGLSGWTQPCLKGDGENNTHFLMGVGKLLVDANDFWNTSDFENFEVVGGYGAVRNRESGPNVAGNQWANGIKCTDYTGSCLSDNSSDLPYLVWNWNTFQALNDNANTTGIAHLGSDKGTIMGNNCLISQYCIKLGLGGIGVAVTDTDFIQFRGSPGTTRAGLWVVPAALVANGSIGLMLDWNKFGNENLGTADRRIIFAGTATGDFGTSALLTTPSTGYIAGMRMTETNRITGASGVPVPLVYTYTPNLRDDNFAGMVSGDNPSYIIQGDAGVTFSNDYTSQNSNRCGPFIGYASLGGSTQITNVPGICTTSDPLGTVGMTDSSVTRPNTTGAGVEAVQLVTNPINSYTMTTGTKTQITDPYGRTDAARLTSDSSGNLVAFSPFAVNMVIGKKTQIGFWAELATSGTPGLNFNVRILDTANNIIYAQPISLPATSGWHFYGLPPETLRASLGANIPPVIQISNTTSETSSFSIEIAAVQVYQADEPLSNGRFLNPLAANTVLAGCIGGVSGSTAAVQICGSGANEALKSTVTTDAPGVTVIKDDGSTLGSIGGGNSASTNTLFTGNFFVGARAGNLIFYHGSSIAISGRDAQGVFGWGSASATTPQFQISTAGAVTMAGSKLTPTSTDPGCTVAGDIGRQWMDSTSAVTTHFKVCAEVSSSPAWVTVF